MQVYVAGSLDDIDAVRAVQAAIVEAGHDLELDWTTGPDADLSDYARAPDDAARLARLDLGAVLSAEALVLVASDHPGRGMFIEFGAVLCRAERGELEHVVVVGAGREDSVFFFHPAVRRCTGIEEWLDSLD